MSATTARASPAAIGRLTERFYRVDAAARRDTGAQYRHCLSIVKHVVQRHGGARDIQSEQGRGIHGPIVVPAARGAADCADATMAEEAVARCG